MPINPNDQWYKAETIAPEMQKCIDRLRVFFNVPPINLGSKGDLNHMRGGHRSYNFIKNSPYCTSRTYTVSRTPGDRSGGSDKNWLAAMDISLDNTRLIAMCKRIDAAVRSGEYEFITEWYGNDDGDNRVDGYDNISNVVASSDDSHLWHCHLTFDRGYLNDAQSMSKLYTMLTGQGEDDMLQSEDMKIVPDLVQPFLDAGAKVDKTTHGSVARWIQDGVLRGYQAKQVAGQALAVAQSNEKKLDMIVAEIAKITTGGVDPVVVAKHIAALTAEDLATRIKD